MKYAGIFEIISAYDYAPEVTVRNGQEITDVEFIPIAISSIDTFIRLGYEVMTEEIKLNKFEFENHKIMSDYCSP
jgi:hypothetical protein